MKKMLWITLAAFLFSSPAFAESALKDTPRITDLSKVRKKPGADDLAARAKNANTVAALKQIVLELIEPETGGK